MREDFDEPTKEVLTKAFNRIVSIDSRRWIEFLMDVLPRLMDIRFEQLTEIQIRMMWMFYVTVWEKYIDRFDNDTYVDEHSELISL